MDMGKNGEKNNRKKTGPKGPNRTGPQREADYLLISEGLKAGRDRRLIREDIQSARPYNYSESTFKNDVREIRRQWRDASFANIGELQQDLYIKLLHTYAQAETAFQKSREPRLSHTKYKSPGADGKEKESTATTQVSTAGDPRWLEIKKDCADKIARLFGGYTQPAQLDTDGQPIGVTMIFNTGGKSPKELTDFPVVRQIEGQEIKPNGAREDGEEDD
jgi:hypothetical protein